MVLCLFNGLVESYRLSELSDDELLDVIFDAKGFSISMMEKGKDEIEDVVARDGTYIIMVNHRTGGRCGKQNSPCTSAGNQVRNPPYTCCQGSYSCFSSKCRANE